MYTPAYARMENEREARTLIAAQPFATFVVAPKARPVIAYVPFVIDPVDSRYLIGHVARANAVWSEIGDGCEALASFRGADAYITPALYPSKHEHGRVVPTWNYIAVEVRGRAVVEEQPEQIRRYVEALTDAMEAAREAPWHVNDAPEDYIDKLCHAIVGIRMEISETSGIRKLSQNRNEADFHGVANGLALDPKSSSREIAGAMRSMRRET
jgi:transcriptional regulator